MILTSRPSDMATRAEIDDALGHKAPRQEVRVSFTAVMPPYEKYDEHAVVMNLLEVIARAVRQSGIDIKP